LFRRFFSTAEEASSSPVQQALVMNGYGEAGSVLQLRQDWPLPTIKSHELKGKPFVSLMS
jgi:hypothetical protein